MKGPPKEHRPAGQGRVGYASEPPKIHSREFYLHYGPPMEWLDWYLARGWALFPIYEIAGDECSCWRGRDCKNPGKHPRCANGFHAASTDRRRVRSWWHQWPGANFGIRTGASTGLVVVDVDPDHGGNSAIADLKNEHGQLPRTYQVETGGRGLHFYFSMHGIMPPIRNSAGLLGPGIDIRAEGGYVIGPPSQTLKGRYSVETFADLAPIPVWMNHLLQEKKPAQKQTPHKRAAFSVTGPSATMSEFPRSLDEAVMAMLKTPEGRRNHTLNGLAFWAGQRIARGFLSRGDVVRRLTIAAELSGLDDNEIDATLASGLNAGLEAGH